MEVTKQAKVTITKRMIPEGMEKYSTTGKEDAKRNIKKGLKMTFDKNRENGNLICFRAIDKRASTAIISTNR